MLGMVEDLLAVADAAGLEGFQAVAAVHAILVYVLMRCEAEATIGNARAVRRALAPAESERHLPRLSALAPYYTTAEFDRHFEYGLHALVARIRSSATLR